VLVLVGVIWTQMENFGFPLLKMGKWKQIPFLELMNELLWIFLIPRRTITVGAHRYSVFLILLYFFSQE
jgi:hypothetical protein